MTENQSPLRVNLSEERRGDILRATIGFYLDEFDEELSPYRAERLLDFLIREIGAPVYNQAIQDARGFMVDKLNDLEGEFYEPESR